MKRKVVKKGKSRRVKKSVRKSRRHRGGGQSVFKEGDIVLRDTSISYNPATLEYLPCKYTINEVLPEKHEDEYLYSISTDLNNPKNFEDFSNYGIKADETSITTNDQNVITSILFTKEEEGKAKRNYGTCKNEDVVPQSKIKRAITK